VKRDTLGWGRVGWVGVGWGIKWGTEVIHK
jgi:hypothetical protein